MRHLILIASLALAANTLADEKPGSATRELDKSSPQLMSADAPEVADAKEKQKKSKGRAQDYNSSRSNTTSAADRHEDGVVHRDIAARKAEASDYGLSRATEASEGKVRAQDYNSSRSNTTAAREEKEGDLDRDGRADILACRDGADEDCDDGDDRGVRKKPAKR